MAILKHIKSRNANYSDAIDYLLFQHDESTGKKIKDEMGRSLLRDEFYMDGLNCDPMSFDKECSLTNTKFHKNKKSSEIKKFLDEHPEYTQKSVNEICMAAGGTDLLVRIFCFQHAMQEKETRMEAILNKHSGIYPELLPVEYTDDPLN